MIKADISDCASMQFENFCKLPSSTHKNEFKEFDIYKHKLHSLLSAITIKKIRFDSIFKVPKIAMVPSHGNAVVESGFSINAVIIVENLHETSVVAQRQVYNGSCYYGGVLKVEIVKAMLESVRKPY